MRQILLITLGTIAAVGAVVIGYTYTQVNEERLNLSADLQYRTRLLSDSLKESIEPNLARSSTTTLTRIVNKFADRERIVGLAVFNSGGITLAASEGMPKRITDNPDFVFEALNRAAPLGRFEEIDGAARYLFVSPLFDNRNVVSGALVTVQNAAYIEEALSAIWKRNLLRLLVQIFVFSSAIVLLIRFALVRIMRRFADSVKSARVSRGASTPGRVPFFLRPLASEITKMGVSLAQARFAASEEARMRMEKLDSPWTAERLKEFIKAYLKDQKIFLVFTQEPYERYYDAEGKMNYRPLANGVATSYEPLMEACDGTWIAQSGTKEDATVPTREAPQALSENPKYTLKRVVLTKKEEQGYNKGYSIEGLYPLCLNTHTRPNFREEDWWEYQRVNEKFADAVISEIRNVQRPIIIVNEYYFTLLPRLIKASRPDARIGIFWHTPWPSAEAFSICPQRKEILEGLLGADIIGFNTPQFCNNFIDTVGKNIESLIDFEKVSITKDGHMSYIRSFPVSIAFTREKDTEGARVSGRNILNRLNIRTKYIGLGVDRMDYAKGIPERFRGIEYFLDIHPEFRKQFTFLQIAAPDRADIKKYMDYKDIVVREAERINKKFGTTDWRPIVLEPVQYSHEDINALYKVTDICLVTSLHDSMNLVSKEYVGARHDKQGVLVLSQFAGAAHDLRGAVVVNPYSTKEIADALHKGLTMPPAEQRRRMETMRTSVKDYNIYRWAAELLKAVADL